ncbi:TPA: hypothetical protein ACGHYA_000480 [Shigella flexneri]
MKRNDKILQYEGLN